MSLSKKTRFEIFKRDSFACQYCGRMVPEVILEVDHIIPIAKDGNDDTENLITSCFDCNRGKRDNTLGTSLLLKRDTEAEIEKIQQLEAYFAHLKSFDKLLRAQTKRIEKIFKLEFPDQTFNEQGCQSVQRILRKLCYSEVEESMNIAISLHRQKDWKEAQDIFMYFTGVCWNKIKGNPAPWKRGKK